MKKTLLKSSLFLGLAFLSFSCNDEATDGSTTPGSPNVKFEYSSATLSRTSNATATVKGNSSADWTIEIAEDAFFTVSPMNGAAGEFELTVTSTSENTAVDDRKSSFVFNAGGRKFPVTVIQSKDEIRIETSLDDGEDGVTFQFNSDGILTTTDVLTVEANTDWVTSGSEDWITVDPISGSFCIGSPVTVTPVVTENPFAELRTGTFSVGIPGGQTYTYNIEQAAAAFSSEVIFPDDITIVDKAISGISGAGQTVEFTIKSNSDWSITADEDWITFDPSSNEASVEPVTVKMTIAGSTDFDNPRNGSFAIDYTAGSDNKVEYTVNQNKGDMPIWANKLLQLFENLKEQLGWSSDIKYTEWQGLVIENGELVGLDISNKSLSGNIPNGDWSQFEFLRDINLSNNKLTGTIPSLLASLPLLETLDLSNNNLTGSLDNVFAKLNATTFKVSGNKLSGTVCADFADNLNYSIWNPMVNIFPQQGDVSDPDAANYNPKNWNFTLTEAGVLRVLYNTMDGKNWSKYQSANWRTSETIKADAGNNGINQVKNGKITKIIFDCGLSGTIPYELAMLKSLIEIDFKNSGAGITKIHKSYIQNLTAINLNQCQIKMEFNDLWDMLNTNVTAVKIMNQGGNLSTVNGISDDVLKFTKLNTLSINGNSLSGTVSDKVIAKFKATNGGSDAATKGLFMGNNFVDKDGNPLVYVAP